MSKLILSDFEKAERLIGTLIPFNQCQSFYLVKQQMRNISILTHRTAMLSDDEREIIGNKIYEKLFGKKIGEKKYFRGSEYEKKIREEIAGDIEKRNLQRLEHFFGDDVATKIKNNEKLI